MTSSFSLRAAAHQAMLDNGFLPDVPAAVRAEVDALPATPRGDDAHGAPVQDLRQLPWSSIDNDNTKDLDQLEVAEPVGDGTVRVLVAIADVDATVRLRSATNQFAATNATSVYTGVETFPMLPDRLSTDLTSLGQTQDRTAVVIEFVVAPDGTTRSHDAYRALVRNYAKLAYSSVGAWLDGHGDLPVAATPVIQDQLRLQDRVAQTLRTVRARAGALQLDTIEAESVVYDGTVTVQLVPKTRASHLIEDFMIAANVAMAQFLDAHGSPAIRRVVRTPERWDRIVALAARSGDTLPAQPDSAALEGFLAKHRQADPVHFPDLSLAVVKLIGPGEYALHVPGTADPGHFGLAVHDYTHSTAPNRRFADLVTQRLLKAVLGGSPAPYSPDELAQIARHSTEREDAARKVERQVRKCAAAVAMARHIGQTYDAIVTGVTPRGTFVRLISPPVEGRVMHGERGVDVGDKVRVTLTGTDPQRGFVDFDIR